MEYYGLFIEAWARCQNWNLGGGGGGGGGGGDEDIPFLHQTEIFNVKAEMVDTKSNKARAMKLEAQMYEAERAIVRQSWRYNALKFELSEV